MFNFIKKLFRIKKEKLLSQTHFPHGNIEAEANQVTTEEMEF